MSPLTKLFVVLLVLVSVALSAGTITFVNQLDPLQTRLKTTESRLQAAEALANKNKSDLDAAQQAISAQQLTFNSDLAAARAEGQRSAGDVTTRDAQIATLNNNIAVLTSANNSQSTALSVSEESKSKLNEQVSSLRKDVDERLRQNADLSRRVNTLTAENDQLERQRRVLSEQLTDASGKTERQSRLLKDMGVTEAQLTTAGTGAGAPDLNGVVNSRRNIAGIEYATISIGSREYVTPGMKFQILDKSSGAFLGELRVTDVDENNATGTINAAPTSLGRIQAGNVVKTKI